MSEKRAATLQHDTRDDGTPVLRGYAALYNVEAVIGGMFREQIAPGAFDEAIVRDDVRALFNHDPNFILGRTRSGTLRLSSDSVGLAYEIDVDPDDELSMRVYRNVKKGDISQSSFGFEVRGQEWAPIKSEALPLRTITRVALYDVSPVTYPAYAETTVSARDLPRAVSDETDALDAMRLRHLSARLAAYQDV